MHASSPTPRREPAPRPANHDNTERRVAIHLLGRFEVVVDGVPVPPDAWKRRKARSIVKLLALAPGHVLHREEVIEQLWPDLDGDAASSNLRLILHLARRALRPASDGSLDLLHVEEDHVRLGGSRHESIQLDISQFTAAAADAHRTQTPAAYQIAIDLYTGDLLPEDRYEDWATAPRELLRESYLDLLAALARLHELRSEYATAITVLERLVAVDSTHEDAHVGLMRVHALSGRPGQALRQYARLRDALTRELDVEPSATSQSLHADIAAGRFPPQGARSHSGGHAGNTIVPGPSPSSPSRKHNLPEPLTRFVGREQGIADITRLLPTTRLMTLTGTGGAGKSRLALEVGRELVDVYRDGVWLVELASLSDPALVPDAVAAAVNVREQSGHAMIETLVDALHTRSLVLVLDNCEHLIDACASLVTRLLAACPQLLVLATSREALRVPGEVLWRVPSLSMPPTLPPVSQSSEPFLDQLARAEAVALFVDRVRWVRPNFVLTRGNAEAVIQICNRLDGLPLALELAAARASILDPEQLVARLDDALGVLSVGSRTAPSRQQTLQATLDWSYDLLNASEQWLLQRLSVFAGGWTLEAAENVCVGPVHRDPGNNDRAVSIRGGDVLTLLAQLIDKSLVQVEDKPTVSGSSAGIRYRLLETVRQFAAARLATSHDDVEEVGKRHADYFLSLAMQAEPAFTGPEQAMWLNRLDREHDNLRAALRWSVEHGDVEREAQLCAALWRFWYYHSHLIEGQRWLENMIERIHHDTVPVLVRAKILYGAGTLAWNRGDPERSAALSHQALSLFEEIGDRHGVAAMLHTLGVVAEMRGTYPEATRRYQEALRLREQIGDTAGAATTLHNLGNLSREQADLDEAAALFERSLALQRQIGNRRGVAIALSSLAVVALDEGDYASAAALSTQSLELYQTIGARSLMITALNNLGYALMFQGDHERAVTHQAECLRVAVESGDRRGIAYGLEGVASAIALHDTSERGAQQSARLFGTAEKLREAVGVPLPPADLALNERSMATARTSLGDRAYDTAWRDGRALLLEEAIAEALALTAPPSSTAPTPTAIPAPSPLSQREHEVALLVANGQTNRQIATTLGIANRTVDTHVSNLLRKLGLASRSEVRSWSVEQQLISIPNDVSSP